MFVDGDAYDGMLRIIYVTLLVMIPLGLWKLCEIIYWLFTHIHVHMNWS